MHRLWFELALGALGGGAVITTLMTSLINCVEVCPLPHNLTGWPSESIPSILPMVVNANVVDTRTLPRHLRLLPLPLPRPSNRRSHRSRHPTSRPLYIPVQTYGQCGRFGGYNQRRHSRACIGCTASRADLEATGAIELFGQCRCGVCVYSGYWCGVEWDMFGGPGEAVEVMK